MHPVTESDSSSFVGALCGGTLVAMTGLLVFGPLAVAIDLSMDHEAPLLMQGVMAVLAFIALFLGGLSAGRLQGHRSTAITAVSVWGATALIVIGLAALGLDVPDFGVSPFWDDDSVLMPFVRYTAWSHVLSLAVSVVAALCGTWLGSTVAHGRRHVASHAGRRTRASYAAQHV